MLSGDWEEAQLFSEIGENGLLVTVGEALFHFRYQNGLMERLAGGNSVVDATMSHPIGGRATSCA
jgi:hypothetical protein